MKNLHFLALDMITYFEYNPIGLAPLQNNYIPSFLLQPTQQKLIQKPVFTIHYKTCYGKNI